MGFTALIAGGLGAVGSIGSALIGSNASKNASNAQVQLGQEALAQQQALFNQGLGIATNALNPYITAGQSVLPTLKGLITPGENQNALLSQTPGFQFAQQYGTMAAQNALSGRGLGLSAGPLATAVSQFNTGLAQNTWQSVVNALQGYAGLGANAAGSLGGAALGGAVQSGNAQAQTLTGIGNARASGILGSANALSGGLGGLTNSAVTASLLSGGGGLYNSLSGPAYGGGNALTDAYGGNPNNPLPGLVGGTGPNSDYG